ncbi:MAG: hypothetical protein SVR94_19110 [Pseudomonadota bacterium]|nr:hypothetical protein [Pseudomonadota bacterium]
MKNLLFVILLFISKISLANQWFFPMEECTPITIDEKKYLGEEGIRTEVSPHIIQSEETSIEECPAHKKVSFEPRVTFGIMQLSYEDYFMGGLKVNLPFRGTGLLFHYDKWVVDFYVQNTFPSTDSDSGRKIKAEMQMTDMVMIDKIGELKTFDLENKSQNEIKQKIKDIEFLKLEEFEFPTLQKQDIEHNDYYINMGYHFYDRLWFFFGYRWGKTIINGQASIFTGTMDKDKQNTPPNELPKVDNPNLRGGIATTLITEARIKTEGPFFGIEYNWDRDGTRLSVNVARIGLNGDYRYTNSYISSQNFDEDAILDDSHRWGWTGGIHLNAPLKNFRLLTIRYLLSLNMYRYEMDINGNEFIKIKRDGNKIGASGFRFEDFSVKENILTFKAGLLLQWW